MKQFTVRLVDKLEIHHAVLLDPASHVTRCDVPVLELLKHGGNREELTGDTNNKRIQQMHKYEHDSDRVFSFHLVMMCHNLRRDTFSFKGC
jgi:hypothetical protein